MSSQLSLENQHNVEHYHHPDIGLERRIPDFDGNMVIQTNGMYNAPSYSSSISQSNPRDLSPDASRHSLVNSDIIQSNNYRAALPEYRKTPDYETAMRQRRERSALSSVTDLNQNVSTLGYGQVESNLYQQSPLRNGPPSEQKLRYRLSYNGPGPVVGNGIASYRDTSVESLQHALFNRNMTHMVHTISVPELSSNTFQTTQEYIAAKVLKEQFRPPPPYPRGSTSTPDLAHQSLRNYLMSSSSPDLVDRKIRTHFEPLQEVVHPGGGTSMNNAMSTSVNGDLSQSLPMDAFENLRIQEQPPLEIQHGYNVYPSAVPSVVPMYNPPVPHHPANLRFTFTETAGQCDMPVLGAPAGYEDRAGSYSPKGNRAYSPNILFSPMPLVSPPSEFADTSDIDSNMSPGSVGSPPHHFRLPSPGVTYPREIQVQVMQAGVNPDMREVNQYGRHPTVDQTRPYLDKETAFTGASVPVTVEFVPRKSQSDSPTCNNNPNQVNSQANRNSAISDSDPSSISEHPSPSSRNPNIPEESKRDSLGAQATSGYGTSGESDQEPIRDEEPAPESSKAQGISGPLKVAAMSGLTMMRPEEDKSDGEEEKRHPRDARVSVTVDLLKT